MEASKDNNNSATSNDNSDNSTIGNFSNMRQAHLGAWISC